MVGRGAVNFVSGNHGETYFFHDNKYVRVKWTPGHYDDAITFGPTEINKYWTALKATGFSRVDAVLPIPGDLNRAYFFCGDKYARVQFTPGDGGNEQILGGVRSLSSNWHSLTKAGWSHVDAALIVPGMTHEALFFSGNEICRVSFKEGTYDPDDLLEGPFMIREHWPNLGFPKIDTIIPDPASPSQAYVFYGDQASRIELVPGGGIDVKTGPKKAADYWQSLHKAGFY